MKIKDEQLQHHIKGETAKISALSWGKIDKYEYLAREEIFPSDQSRIIEQAKFTYSPLSKAFEKLMKIIEGQEEKKQVEALKNLKPITTKLPIKYPIPENALSEEDKNELNKIKERGEMVDRENIYYKMNNVTHNFQNFWTITNFSRDIYNGRVTTKDTGNDQSDLIVKISNFRKKVKPKNSEKKQQEDCYQKLI